MKTFHPRPKHINHLQKQLRKLGYPMNWSWITGNITEEDYRERHPLEFEREVEGKSGDA